MRIVLIVVVLLLIIGWACREPMPSDSPSMEQELGRMVEKCNDGVDDEACR